MIDTRYNEMTILAGFDRQFEISSIIGTLEKSRIPVK
jgi:hypothetical protein